MGRGDDLILWQRLP
ncbi:hypothetical protein YPPY36_1703, partial [Yersinia pestis PY-36]